MNEPSPARRSSARWIIALVVVASVAALAAGFAALFLYASYKQPSGSMWPSYAVGARVTANRLDKKPVRGAVIVFEYPEHREQLFFKRVVGMPGDVIHVTKGAVFVNGWPVPRCEIGKTSYSDAVDGTKHDGDLDVEWLGEATYLVFHDAQALALDFQGPFTTKPGEYFVLGDNRENSHDSRMWWGGQGGGVPADHVVARVRGGETPRLPAGSEALSGALAACLAKRPASTNPPPPK